MSGDGDGWVTCAAGHRHWGRFGAAGLLIGDGQSAILQHRAPWTHEGGTWALPGGARDSHEDPTSTALREAREEADIRARTVEPFAMRIDDHGGWSYTTVLARPIEAIAPRAANAESTEVRWWRTADIDGLPLHHGFAATWPHVRDSSPRLQLIVDGRSDARFAQLLRPGADNHSRFDRLARHGVSVAQLPAGLTAASGWILLPQITVILASDDQPDPAVAVRSDAGGSVAWWQRAVRVVITAEPVAHVLAAVRSTVGTHQAVVITADQAVRASIAPAATGLATVEAPWLIDLLDQPAIS